MLCNLCYIFFRDVHKNNIQKILPDYGKLVQNNVVHFVDSDDETNKWMCVNKDCLYHTKNEDNFVSTNTVDDKDVVDDDDIEWI